MRLLLDASAIIEWERDNPRAKSTIEECEQINISVVAAYEVLVGARENLRGKIEGLFASCPPRPFNMYDALIASEMTKALQKAGKKVKTLDILIAAQAKRLGLTVLARDKDFDVIKGIDGGVSVMQLG